MATKICKKCFEVKSLDDFGRRASVRDGKRAQCRSCENEYRRLKYNTDSEYKKRRRAEVRKANFGVDQVAYGTMMESQDGKCAICGTIPTDKSMAVDHDHSTGKIRDLLCHHCNAGLGMFRDNIDILSSAIEYLRNHNHGE